MQKCGTAQQHLDRTTPENKVSIAQVPRQISKNLNLIQQSALRNPTDNAGQNQQIF